MGPIVKLLSLVLTVDLCLIFSLAQQAQVVPAVNDLRNGVDTIRPPSQAGPRTLMPMVDVNKENNQSKVDVHVPIFFDMTNLNNPNQSRLDLSVLQGLVTVQKDKQRDQDGQMNGPMKVTVFGIPVYTSKGNFTNSRIDSLAEPIRQSRKLLEDSIGQKRSELSSKADELSRRVADQLQLANNKMMGTLSNFLTRVTSMLRQPSSRDSSPASGEKAMPPIQQQQQQLPVPSKGNDMTQISVRTGPIQPHSPGSPEKQQIIQQSIKDVPSNNVDQWPGTLKPIANSNKIEHNTISHV